MSFENFIYEKENVLSKELCKEIIESGSAVISSGALTKHHAGKTQFKEGVFGRHDVQVYMPEDMPKHFGEIQSAVIDAVSEYGEQVQSIHHAPLICPIMKLQYTPLTGGYSVWHIEQNAGSMASRVLAWSIYLNDVEEGGETEFLYQGSRYKPRAGSLLMWPASITHPHRGNPPISNEKFVVTGWLNWARSEAEDYGLRLIQDAENHAR